MIAILSPAKQMVSGTQIPSQPLSVPRFLEQARQLNQWIQQYSPWELESLLRINPALALKAYSYHQEFSQAKPGTAALLSYRGLAYQHISYSEWNAGDFAFAAEHLRILSAFYGLLRPLDEMKPYRLEFLCKIKPYGKSLYSFWNDRVYRALYQQDDTVVNLASAEYAKLVRSYLLPHNRFLTCDFVIWRKGKLRTLPTEAKMSRGEMADFIVRNRLHNPEELKTFHRNGYSFQDSLSTDNRYVFLKQD